MAADRRNLACWPARGTPNWSDELGGHQGDGRVGDCSHAQYAPACNTEPVNALITHRQAKNKLPPNPAASFTSRSCLTHAYRKLTKGPRLGINPVDPTRGRIGDKLKRKNVSVSQIHCDAHHADDVETASAVSSTSELLSMMAILAIRSFARVCAARRRPSVRSAGQS